MSDSIDAIGGVTAPAAAPDTASAAPSSPAGYADATAEVARADGTVVVIVTDARGEIVSTTTLHNQPGTAAPVEAAPAPAHVLSFEA